MLVAAVMQAPQCRWNTFPACKVADGTADAASSIPGMLWQAGLAADCCVPGAQHRCTSIAAASMGRYTRQTRASRARMDAVRFTGTGFYNTRYVEIEYVETDSGGLQRLQVERGVATF